MNRFDGIMTALTTPICTDGTVNAEQLQQLIDYQIEHKVHSLLLLGGTGEYTSLTMEERLRAVEIGVRAVNHRVPLIVGVLETGVGVPEILPGLQGGRSRCPAGPDSLLLCWNTRGLGKVLYIIGSGGGYAHSPLQYSVPYQCQYFT